MPISHQQLHCPYVLVSIMLSTTSTTRLPLLTDCKTATVGSPYNNWCEMRVCILSLFLTSFYSWDIYTHAGITVEQFNQYNPGLNCNVLQIGQRVCISPGTLPSNAPSPNPVGLHWQVQENGPHTPILGWLMCPIYYNTRRRVRQWVFVYFSVL